MALIVSLKSFLDVVGFIFLSLVRCWLSRLQKEDQVYRSVFLLKMEPRFFFSSLELEGAQGDRFEAGIDWRDGCFACVCV